MEIMISFSYFIIISSFLLFKQVHIRRHDESPAHQTNKQKRKRNTIQIHFYSFLNVFEIINIPWSRGVDI